MWRDHISWIRNHLQILKVTAPIRTTHMSMDSVLVGFDYFIVQRIKSCKHKLAQTTSKCHGSRNVDQHIVPRLSYGYWLSRKELGYIVTSSLNGSRCTRNDPWRPGMKHICQWSAPSHSFKRCQHIVEIVLRSIILFYLTQIIHVEASIHAYDFGIGVHFVWASLD